MERISDLRGIADLRRDEPVQRQCAKDLGAELRSPKAAPPRKNDCIAIKLAGVVWQQISVIGARRATFSSNHFFSQFSFNPA
jgi:hypothetical protein